MVDETLLAFIRAPVNERFRLALDPSAAPSIEAYLGATEFARYEALAAAAFREGHLGADHLGVDSPENLVFVPGVMGSLLVSEGLGGVWWVDVRTRRHIEDLRLAPSGLDDTDRRSRVAPRGVHTSYEPFLAQVLGTPEFNHRLFPYDWRKSLLRSAGELRRLVQEIYAANGGRPVHLVGHSMGGLMIRAALMEHGDDLWPIVGKICYIATPHYGSPAIAGYLKNHFWGLDMLIVLRKYLSRQAFRSLWGVMELLPAPRGVYPGSRDGGDHPCGNFDFYDAAAWQLDLDHDEQARLQAVLDGAATFHRRLYDDHMALDQERRSRMSVIAGLGMKTLFRLEFRHGLGRLWKEMSKITERERGNPDRDGDGRVPLASAELEYMGAIRYARGTHGNLPNLTPVAQDVFRWLRGEEMQLPDSPRAALARHLGAETAEDDDDPGYLAPLEDEPSEADLDALDAQLEAGARPDFIQTKLL